MRNDDSEGDRLYWFEQLQKYYEPLYRFCCRLSNGDESRADDLIQQVACRIMQHRPKPTSVKKPLFYLFRITKNCWIDSKPTTIEVDLEQAFGVIAECSGRECQANLELVDIVNRALKKMEARFPGFNEMFRMWLDGATLREINESCDRNRGYAEFRWTCFLNEIQMLMNTPELKSTKKPAA